MRLCGAEQHSVTVKLCNKHCSKAKQCYKAAQQHTFTMLLWSTEPNSVTVMYGKNNRATVNIKQHSVTVSPGPRCLAVFASTGADWLIYSSSSAGMKLHCTDVIYSQNHLAITSSTITSYTLALNLELISPRAQVSPVKGEGGVRGGGAGGGTGAAPDQYRQQVCWSGAGHCVVWCTV